MKKRDKKMIKALNYLINNCDSNCDECSIVLDCDDLLKGNVHFNDINPIKDKNNGKRKF